MDVKYGRALSDRAGATNSNGRIASLSLRVSERESIDQASAYCRIAYPLRAKSARTISFISFVRQFPSLHIVGATQLATSDLR